MALLDVPATKSALLALRRQLVFAREGYELLDRKRELLLAELRTRRAAAAAAREAAEAALRDAFSELRSASLDAGAAVLDGAALGAAPAGGVTVRERRVMGVRVPEVSAGELSSAAVFGPGLPAEAARARGAFARALPRLAELAGLETAVYRLAAELARTQRRCNALSKKVIPEYSETAAYLAAALEEREREYYVVLKMLRDRLRAREG